MPSLHLDGLPQWTWSEKVPQKPGWYWAHKKREGDGWADGAAPAVPILVTEGPNGLEYHLPGIAGVADEHIVAEQYAAFTPMESPPDIEDEPSIH